MAPILEQLKKSGAKTVWLAPFMLVAGDHAKNDLGGDEEDSWASMLRKEGFTVKTHLRGLGGKPGHPRRFFPAMPGPRRTTS